jgi:hypothetical protein
VLTKAQAVTVSKVHAGPKPSQKECYVWRRNGKTQTWVTRPEDFRLPVKFGMYEYGQVTPGNAEYFHTEEECPFAQPTQQDGEGSYINFGPVFNPDGTPSDVTLDMLAGTGRNPHTFGKGQ